MFTQKELEQAAVRETSLKKQAEKKLEAAKQTAELERLHAVEKET